MRAPVSAFLSLVVLVTPASAEPTATVDLGEPQSAAWTQSYLVTKRAHDQRKIDGGESFADAMWWHVVRLDGRPIPLGLDPHDGYWTARSDLDGDGVAEATRLEPEDASGTLRFTGVLTSTIQAPRPAQLGGGTSTVPYRLELTIEERGEESPRVTWTGDYFRTGVLPDGTPFAIESAGGRYDAPQARLTVDQDQDGKPDYGDRLAHYPVSGGIVSARENSWTFAIDPAGDRVAFAPSDKRPTGLRVGSPAPDFRVTSTDGQVHTLERYRGAPLLLDFWATWCGPCIEQHPALEELAREHDVPVLGISADAKATVLKRYLREHPMAWPNGAVGPKGSAIKDYGIHTWPTYVVIDAAGSLRSFGTLSVAREVLEGMEPAHESGR